MSGGSVWAGAVKRPLSVAKIDGILGITDDTPFEQFMAQREALRTVLGVLAQSDDGPISADDSNEAIRVRVRELRERERERNHGYGVAVCNMVLLGTTHDVTVHEARTGERPSKWVSSAWVNGRNAMVFESDGRYRMHAYATDPDGNGPVVVGKATWEHHGRAFMAGDTWTRRGVWDVSGAVSVEDETPIVEAATPGESTEDRVNAKLTATADAIRGLRS